jgi:hypothetical protein
MLAKKGGKRNQSGRGGVHRTGAVRGSVLRILMQAAIKSFGA